MLVTSRQPLPGDTGQDSTASVSTHNINLEVLPPEAARKLICSVASAQLLTSEDVEEVAAVCGGNPLLLRVTADALASGRITLNAIRDAARGVAGKLATDTMASGSSSAAVVAVGTDHRCTAGRQTPGRIGSAVGLPLWLGGRGGCSSAGLRGGTL